MNVWWSVQACNRCQSERAALASREHSACLLLLRRQQLSLSLERPVLRWRRFTAECVLTTSSVEDCVALLLEDFRIGLTIERPDVLCFQAFSLPLISCHLRIGLPLQQLVCVCPLWGTHARGRCATGLCVVADCATRCCTADVFLPTGAQSLAHVRPERRCPVSFLSSSFLRRRTRRITQSSPHTINRTTQ